MRQDPGASKWKEPEVHGPAVLIKDAVKSWGKVKALRHVDLEVRRGEIFGLIGPNGAGKSTLMRSLLGMVKLDEGNLRILGINPRVEELRIKAYTGFVPESESPPSFLTLNEFLDFVMHSRGLSSSEEKKNRWINFFDINGSGDMIARNMSKGTRQKLMLASAFIHEPPLLLLDEPFINLDPIYQRKVKDHLMEYSRQNHTVLISTHILALAEELCDRVAIIHKGRILKAGPTKELLDSYGTLEDAFLKLVGYH